MANSQVPDTLYKYFPPDRIDVLENLELRFSRPSEFNDRFDSHFLVSGSQGLGGVSARVKLQSRIGVLCLTEKANNHLMWVNYAHNHAGFVLGFDAHAAFFSNDERTLSKVKYRERPKVVTEASVDACFYK